MGQRLLPLLLAVVVGLAACAPARPDIVNDVVAVKGPGDEVSVTHVDPASGEGRADRWEILFSTSDPEQVVDAVRDVFVRLDYRIDDANDGLGFVAGDTVEVREIFTTQPGTRKILVGIGCCIETID